MKTINNVFIDDEENIVISYENEDGLVHEFETPLVNALPEFIGGLSVADFKLLDRQIKRCGNHAEIIYRLFSSGGVPVILGVIEINDEFINDSLPFEEKKAIYIILGHSHISSEGFTSYDAAQKFCKLWNLDFNLIKLRWKT